MKRPGNVHVPSLALAVLLGIGTTPGVAQDNKPTVPASDYGKWERLRDRELSRDGRFVAYEIRRVDGHQEVRLRGLSSGATEPARHDLAWAADPEFSADGSWLAVTKVTPDDERKRLEKEEKPVPRGAALLDIEGGDTRDFEGITRFDFDSTGRFLALLAQGDEEDDAGADLLLIDLHLDDQASGAAELTFGNVSDFEWSEKQSLLAMAISTRDPTSRGNGVQVYDAAKGRLRSLASSATAEVSFSSLAWREEATDLAFMKSTKEPEDVPGDTGDDSKPEKAEEKPDTDTEGGDTDEDDSTTNSVLAFSTLETTECASAGSCSWVLDADTPGIPEGHKIARAQPPAWSEDGSRISFGLRLKEEEEDKEEEAEGEEIQAGETDEGEAQSTDDQGTEDLPGLQIWHSKDVRIYPQQKVNEKEDADRSLLAIWHLEDGRVVPLGTKRLEHTEVAAGFDHAVEHDTEPYPWGHMFGRPFEDLWVVDASSGERVQALTKVRAPTLSIAGRYAIYFDGEDHWSLELASGKTTNLTAGLDATFADQEYDVPTDQLPSYGIGGWLEDDEAVLLYDRFDVWRVAPDGSGGMRLTSGESENIEHRVINLEHRHRSDPDEPLPKAGPFYFSVRGEITEERGVARFAGTGSTEILLYEDAYLSQVGKAEDADVFIFRREAHDDSPDLYYADPGFRQTRQVSATNPFQADYAWSRSRLIDFTSEAGRELQAALFYPANHDPAQRYPMIVLTYEILAPQIHRYHVPDERTYYSVAAWTQNGYFVLFPDIVYRAREPGPSAVEAVRPAVRKVIDEGLIDRDRVGLVGHSWGGYQATYLPTRIDTFAASVAGAPLTDFVSFMGQLHWKPGMAELSHWETGQARMEVPFWEDPEAHRRSSPIHKVHEMETPLLMAFGNEDGVVDWDQGTEFYNFARRAGKQMVLLVYEGEGHGFQEEANQIDYHRRILEWFDHYLKGEPAEAWITEGVPLEALEKEKKRVADPPETAATPPS